MAEAIVVGVRVRPFNDREKGLNATCCIDMQGPMTTIMDAAGKSSHFSFDQSFWSHDGFECDGTGYMRPTPGSRYSDQKYVFDSFGQRMLDNAWAGYHCCLFTYGQTGAGKSYSMFGYGSNKGMFPNFCEEIFKRIGENKHASKRYEIMVSMLEIYNETIQDLSVPFDKRPKNGLQIRESKMYGVYVDGIIKHAVDSCSAMEKVIENCTLNRSVGSTQMNATSSRANTIISIQFQQFELIEATASVKVSNLNFVDLAGSERPRQTGAKEARLPDSTPINKPISALRRVIEKLAKRSSNPEKAKNIMVPYRDSVLTRILQNALGGSSRTIMIFNVSPASTNYEETMSTLRCASCAKGIKNAVTVNQSARMEDNLRKKLFGGDGVIAGYGAGRDAGATSEEGAISTFVSEHAKAQARAELDIDALFDAVDIDKSGQLDRFGFVTFALLEYGLISVDDVVALRQEFETLDVDSSGKVTKSEVMQHFRAVQKSTGVQQRHSQPRSSQSSQWSHHDEIVVTRYRDKE